MRLNNYIRDCNHLDMRLQSFTYEIAIILHMRGSRSAPRMLCARWSRFDHALQTPERCSRRWSERRGVHSWVVGDYWSGGWSDGIAVATHTLGTHRSRRIALSQIPHKDRPAVDRAHLGWRADEHRRAGSPAAHQPIPRFALPPCRAHEELLGCDARRPRQLQRRGGMRVAFGRGGHFFQPQHKSYPGWRLPVWTDVGRAQLLRANALPLLEHDAGRV